MAGPCQETKLAPETQALIWSPFNEFSITCNPSQELARNYLCGPKWMNSKEEKRILRQCLISNERPFNTDLSRNWSDDNGSTCIFLQLGKPMQTCDRALEALRIIKHEFHDFCRNHGTVSEADTRANIIDRILREVLFWPQNEISREEHTGRGYMDYCLSIKKRRFVVAEAKKAGLPFTFPLGKHQRSLSLQGAILTDPPLKEAIDQVRGYCDSEGIRYAIATNGYAWILFRAIREDMPWKKGQAIIFPTIEYIEEHFTQFWNLLSYDAISAGALDTEFGVAHLAPRQLHRVVANLFNADLPLQRNRLNAQLQPIIHTIFENIADQDEIEILQSCYVHSESLRIAANDLNCVITDTIPSFLRKEGTEPILQGSLDAGRFGTAILNALKSSQGELILLLGGIGSGKTTFLKRYLRTVGKNALEKHALWFHINFLGACPTLPSRIFLASPFESCIGKST